MIDLNTGKEWVIFVGIIAIVGIAALAAYQITGPVGMEERFQNALGIVGNSGEEPEGFSGFALEGDPVLYAVIVCGLGILCYGAYRQFRI